MDNVVSLNLAANIVDEGKMIFNDLPNNALSVKAQSDLNGITLKTAISEDSCLFADYLSTDTTASTISNLFVQNPTCGYLYTDTTAGCYSSAGYYPSNQEVKETPVNNQLSVKIRKRIKIKCSL